MKTDTLYTSVLGGAMAWLAYFVGGIDQLVISLIIFMAVDYLLGFLVSTVVKNTDSRKMFKGLIKKTAMVLMVIVAVRLDLVTDSEGFMRKAMILFLIGMEGISIVENLGKLGIKVPQFLSKRFAQLQMDNDEKTKGDK